MNKQQNIQNKGNWENVLIKEPTSRKVNVYNFDTDKQEIVLMGDEHIGSKFYDEKFHRKMVDYCLKNNISIILMGDELETSTKTSVGAGVFEQDEIVQKQLEKAVEIYKPLADKGLILGNHIGNHECVREDTEVLTEKGWVLAKNVSYKDKIASFDKKSKVISFSSPLKITKGKVEDIWEVKGNFSKEYVSENHRIFFKGELINIKESPSKINQKDRIYNGKIKTEFKKYSLEEVKFLIWIIADGSLVNRNGKIHHIQFKLSKERKIKSLLKLLKKLKVKFTIQDATKSKNNILQPKVIRIYSTYAKKYSKILNNKKVIPEWFKYLPQKYNSGIYKTLVETDGYESNGSCVYKTTEIINAEELQLWGIFHGFASKITLKYNGSGFKKNCKIQYNIKFVKKLSNKFYCEITNKNKKERVVAITTKDDTLITRNEGVVNFTGNSRVYNHSGANLSKILSSMLDIPYLGVGAAHILRVGKQTYTLYTTHGNSGARTPHTKIANIIKANQMINVEIYAQGHVHQLSHHVQNYYTISKRNKTIVESQRHYILTGSYLTHWGSYAHMGNMEPSRKGSPKLKLGGLEHRIRVSL